MASTAPAEKKRKAAKGGGAAAGGVASAYQRDDPHHTWNQKLMEACLACDAAAVRALIDRGADPVATREVPPLSYFMGPILQQSANTADGVPHAVLFAVDQPTPSAPGQSDAAAAAAAATATAAAAAAAGTVADSLPPLAAMLLSGLNTPAALEVMAVLVQHGASVNDTFAFAGVPLPKSGSGGSTATAADGGGSGGDGGAAAVAGGVGRGKTSRSASADVKPKQSSAKAKQSAIAATHIAAPAGTAAGAFASATNTAIHVLEAPQLEEATIVGSVLHYVVAHGDHAQLTRLLLTTAAVEEGVLEAAGAPAMSDEASEGSASAPPPASTASREAPPPPLTLPYTLLPAVEAETVVGVLHRLRQQRLSSSAAADAAGAGASPTPPAATPGASASRKSRATSSAAALAHTAIAAGGGAAQPAAAALTDTGPASAASLVSSAAAEAVMAALQQLLTQRRTNSGGYGGLPILVSIYPQQQQQQQQQQQGDKKPAGAGVEGNAAAPSAGGPCRLWSLASVCSGDGVAEAPSADVLRQRTRIDLDVLDSCGRSAATAALDRGDALSARLLSFFGARVPFDGLVNACQTRLARACTLGDVARVEALLRQGDSLTQLSADGRYTLVHYAAAQPAVLRVLVERGLSIECENALGESALVSLLRHGTARNDPRCVQTLLALASVVRTAAAEGSTSVATASLVNSMSTTAAANTIRLAQLSTAARRNLILCPPASMNAIAGATPTATAAATTAPLVSFLGGCEVGTWWSFLAPTVTTADVLDTLLRAGAIMQGYVPDEELDLPYVQFAERQALAATAHGVGGSVTAEEAEEAEEADWLDEEEVTEEDEGDGDGDGDGDGGEDQDDAGRALRPSRRLLSASTATARPASDRREHHDHHRGGGGGGGGRRQRQQQQLRPAPLPARLPLRLTPLQWAIVDYHPELIRRLLVDYHVDPMRRDSQGATAVHYAALCTHAPSVLDLLLSPQVLAPSGVAAAAAVAAAGAVKGRLNSNTGPDASVPMAGASLGGLGAGAGAADAHLDVNAVDMAGRTPLFYAAYVGNSAAVQRLMRHGGTSLLCGRADKDGYTPLHVAVQQRHADVVALLVRHSSQLLSSAAGGGGGGGRGQPVDIFAELLGTGTTGATGGGATSGRASRGGARRGSHRSNSTAAAAGGGHHGGASAGGGGAAADLFSNPELMVNVEAEESVTRMTALEMAIKLPPLAASASTEAQAQAQARLLEIVAVLLAEAQASPLRPSGLANGGALLHRAVADGAVQLVELLLSHYADPNETNDADETPLFLALQLLAPTLQPQQPASAADVREQQEQHRRRRTALVRVLLQHGATPYAQSGVHLQTPMHLAASSLGDAEELLQLLFYSTPDAGGVGGNGGTRRQRREQQQQRPLAHRAPSHAADGGDASPYLADSRPLGGGSIARRRQSSTSSSGANGAPGRKTSLERRLRERRSQQQQQQQQQQSRRVSPSSSRRRPWGGSSVVASEAERSGSLTELDGLADDQASLANSSFGFRDTRNSSFTSQEQPSPERSFSRTGTVAGDLGVEDAAAGAVMDEHQRLLLRLTQWQMADHLLSPEHTWMLTDAEGQTPLHRLCSRATRALQRTPAALRLLEDLRDVTRSNSVIAAAAAGVLDEGVESDHVLALCWRLPDSQGRTPLHVAAQTGYVEAVEHILKQAPRSALAVDMHGRTPLHACVLMTTTTTTADGEDGEDGEAATRLGRVLRLLHDAVAAASATSAMPLPHMLHGMPLRRAAGDVLPSPSVKTTPQLTGGAAATAATHRASSHAVAALVQSSSITAQLQRWQQTRHWGCPALAKHCSDGGHHHATAAAATAAAAAAVRPAAVDEWRAYAQTPDGQGRTALLLAAEVGNVTAARELLKTM